MRISSSLRRKVIKYLIVECCRFAGEDDNAKERSKAQKEEMRWWIEKQKNERMQAEREREEAEKAYEAAVISRDKRAMALDQMERDCRRRLNEATAQFNRALVRLSLI